MCIHLVQYLFELYPYIMFILYSYDVHIVFILHLYIFFFAAKAHGNQNKTENKQIA